MRYLVTGGAGFIGSHVVEGFLRRGDEAVVLDDLSTGSVENLKAVHGDIRLVEGSVLEPSIVDELVRHCDAVVHLAAAVGVRLIVERPLESLLTNIRGAEVVLQAAHRHGRKVMVASSSEIYGKYTDGPFKEEDDRVLGSPKVSRWAYSTSKAVDEILAFAYYREKGLPTVVVRLFNTVGPRQTSSYGMVLPNFVEQAVSGSPLTVHGDGKQTRCFCHVSDVVDALLALMDEPEADGEVFNVGTTEEVTIVELAERVLAATGSGSEISFVPYEEAYEEGFEDMHRRVPDIGKLRSLVGWRPRRTLESIIEELVKEARSSEG
jgi:UDP-glucose 4-epimerase